MIYDGLAAIGRYRGMMKGLDVLIDWLAKNDPADLPEGLTEIDGKRVYVNVKEMPTKSFEEARFETHKKYADVQIDLVGAENAKTTPGETVVAVEFDDEADKGYCHEAPGNDDLLDITLAHGHFALYVPGEPHMCNLAIPGNDSGTVKKAVFKVVSDQYWDEV